MGLLDWLGTSSQSQSSVSGIRVAAETDLEKQITPQLGQTLGQLTTAAEAGAGQADVTAGAQGQRDLATLLQQFSSQSGLLQAQQANAGGYAQIGEQLFAGQLRQQQTEGARLAARLGRSVTDPQIQQMLAQQRADTVGSFTAQQSLNAPMQQAQFANQRAGLLQGLASQAFSNRELIMGLGSQLREQDRSYRINTGQQYGETTQMQTSSPLNILGGLSAIAGKVIGMASGNPMAFTGGNPVGEEGSGNVAISQNPATAPAPTAYSRAPAYGGMGRDTFSAPTGAPASLTSSGIKNMGPIQSTQPYYQPPLEKFSGLVNPNAGVFSYLGGR